MLEQHKSGVLKVFMEEMQPRVTIFYVFPLFYDPKSIHYFKGKKKFQLHILLNIGHFTPFQDPMKMTVKNKKGFTHKDLRTCEK